jgi:hypothetical protein
MIDPVFPEATLGGFGVDVEPKALNPAADVFTAPFIRMHCAAPVDATSVTKSTVVPPSVPAAVFSKIPQIARLLEPIDIEVVTRVHPEGVVMFTAGAAVRSLLTARITSRRCPAVTDAGMEIGCDVAAVSTSVEVTETTDRPDGAAAPARRSPWCPRVLTRTPSPKWRPKSCHYQKS